MYLKNFVISCTVGKRALNCVILSIVYLETQNIAVSPKVKK